MTKYLHLSFSLILTINLYLLGCNSNTTSKTERTGEPTIYSVNNEDTEMKVAIQQSRETIDEFATALKSKNSQFKYFGLKLRYDTPLGGEHIWISEINLLDNKFYGILDNLPKSIPNLKLGDTICVANENITDWMYIDNQVLKGGYTIRALRKNMSDREKEQFDSDFGFIIEE